MGGYSDISIYFDVSLPEDKDLLLQFARTSGQEVFSRAGSNGLKPPPCIGF